MLFINRRDTQQILLVATECEQGEAGRFGWVSVVEGRAMCESLTDDEGHDDEEEADAQGRRSRWRIGSRRARRVPQCREAIVQRRMCSLLPQHDGILRSPQWHQPGTSALASSVGVMMPSSYRWIVGSVQRTTLASRERAVALDARSYPAVSMAVQETPIEPTS